MLPDIAPECTKAQVLPLKTGPTNMPATSELEHGVTTTDSSTEHRLGDVSTSHSVVGPRCADRHLQSAVSRPGRDGIKLNIEASRMINLLKKHDALPDSKPDVQGSAASQSYVDKFSEFLSHGKETETNNATIFLNLKLQNLLFNFVLCSWMTV